MGRVFPFEPDHRAGSCANGAGPERLFRVEVSEPSTLRATTATEGTTFDTVLYLRDGCDGAELACHDDVDAARLELGSALAVDLDPGSYVLVVDTGSAYVEGGAVRTPREFVLDVTLTPR